KQIIGRGTRINAEYGKYYFTIMDFRNVTNKFADKDFDGEPVQIKKFGQDDEINPEDPKENEKLLEGETIVVQPSAAFYDEPEKIRKYYVKQAEVRVINDQIYHLDPSGKLISEGLMDYTKKQIGQEYRTLNDFIQKWNITDQKREIINHLAENGLILECLQEEIPGGKDMDPFDLILHVAYGQKPLTRSERARKVQKDSYFNKYGDKARKVIEALLNKYADEGIENLENLEVLTVSPINKLGRPLEIMKLFGGRAGYLKVLKEIETRLYK
ncbi:MAG: type I restriction-modification enzyme R subunit C-terminal domain-containing protein, partial [archaeon]|nr:type I restriction-modification enzyme R subunit C-terminal domain-containing protein [archaeon]